MASPAEIEATQLIQRGNALRSQGHLAEAENTLRQALSLQPARLDGAVALAFLLREQGRLSAASESLLSAWRRQTPVRDIDAQTLGFLRECQRAPAVAEVADAAARRWPDDAHLRAMAGEVAMEQGDFDAARAHLAAAALRDPARGATWLRLAHTHRFAATDDADFVSMQRALQAPASADARRCLGFALGKAYDDLGDNANAARLWRDANADAHRAQPWDRAAWQRFVQERLHAPALATAQRRDDFIPVFVVGLPRTGTTLVASLLSRYAALRARGELNWLAALATRLGAQPTRATLDQAAALFGAQLRQDDAPAMFYLDKNPLNFRYLDAALALFPQAKIIHCVRDSRDTALSIWSQHFAHPDLAWSYAFDDIAAMAADESRLMAHWRQRYAMQIHRLSYEALVSDADAALARLRDFLNLPDTENASEEQSAIRTASVWQARQAVSMRSVNRWRGYAHFLPELTADF